MRQATLFSGKTCFYYYSNFLETLIHLLDFFFFAGNLSFQVQILSSAAMTPQPRPLPLISRHQIRPLQFFLSFLNSDLTTRVNISIIFSLFIERLKRPKMTDFLLEKETLPERGYPSAPDYSNPASKLLFDLERLLSPPYRFCSWTGPKLAMMKVLESSPPSNWSIYCLKPPISRVKASAGYPSHPPNCHLTKRIAFVKRSWRPREWLQICYDSSPRHSTCCY